VKFTIELPDDSDELIELQEIVNEINTENPRETMTLAGYLTNIIRGFLQSRVNENYIGHVRQNLTNLKSQLGSYQSIRRRQNRGN